MIILACSAINFEKTATKELSCVYVHSSPHNAGIDPATVNWTTFEEA